MKVYVTGGTGVIGSRLIKKLVIEGHEIAALVRSQSSAKAVKELGANPVYGDITEIETLGEGMEGSEAVFHLAGWYQTGGTDQSSAIQLNINGTRNVLSKAHQLNIQKIIYSSSVVVFGDTQGKKVDETFYQEGPFLTEYDRTKWVAHYEVAERLIDLGAPITIVIPGQVYGPGDKSAIASLMRLFYRGLLPVIPHPGVTLTMAHVDDIADGFILAWQKGQIGDKYILAGPPVSTSELVHLWASMTNRPEPIFHIPSSWLKPLSPFVYNLEKFISLPPAFSGDAFNMLGATYLASADKAKQELGWEIRPIPTGMEETLDWIARSTGGRPVLHTRNRQLAAFSLLTGLLFFAGWLFNKRIRK